MRTPTSPLVLSLTFLAATGSATAQSLAGRHQIELRLGVWNQFTETRTEIVSGGVSTTVGSSGFVGGLSYGHWLEEYLALKIDVGALAASVDTDVGVSGVSTDVATVAPLLLGLKYYFPRSTYGTGVRPFAGAGVGAFIGSQVETRTGTTVAFEARTESAIGGQLNGGVDFPVSRLVMLSAALGFNVMADFSRSIGGSTNYSGLQLTLGVSLLLGGGARPQ